MVEFYYTSLVTIRWLNIYVEGTSEETWIGAGNKAKWCKKEVEFHRNMSKANHGIDSSCEGTSYKITFPIFKKSVKDQTNT